MHELTQDSSQLYLVLNALSVENILKVDIQVVAAHYLMLEFVVSLLG